MGIQHVGHRASARWTSGTCAKYALAGAVKASDAHRPKTATHTRSSRRTLKFSMSHDRDPEAATGD
eukprot:6181814-Pleurochrysis_carterae.AAC.1